MREHGSVLPTKEEDMSVLAELEPKAVFSYFEKLCSVPHGSHNTKQISDMCVGFAKELGLRCRQDDANNVIIWKDATPGYENSDTVILQGHLDMVCAKTEDCDKDMAVEGLDVMTDGEYVWAKNTSLGGDDCIAVAIALAILAADDIPHPALEAVFTTDEEIGMDGAFALDCSDLKGRLMLNLDSEEEGVFTVSCAGGARADCCMSGERRPLDGAKYAAYTVTISGLQGGHSGAEIDKGRANANALMGRVLYTAMERLGGLRIADLRGGRFDNVICPRCDAMVAVPTDKAGEFDGFIREFDKTLKNEYSAADSGLELSCCRAATECAWDEEETSRLLHTLFALPQGVQEMSMELPGLVQTSLNLGVVEINDGGAHFTYSVRSSIASQKEMLLQKLRAIVEYNGGTVSTKGNYPGWQYTKESRLRDTVMAAYKDLTSREGRIAATHGGLECGLLLEKMPGLDIVSAGPELHDIHSVNERLGVASTGRLYELVCEVLKRSR